MQPGVFDRVRSVLSEALELPPAERRAYLQAHCSREPDVLAEVESLLALQESAAGFLTTPLPELLGAQVKQRRELPAGTLLRNRYRLASVLAESGFATVYLAQDEHVVGRTVVVKLLDQMLGDETLRRAFQSELRSLGGLQHPNVVRLSDVGELADGTPFLVLDYVRGLTLRQVLQAGPLAPPRVRTVIASVGKGLAAAHQLGIWHLDIKPENIILSEPGTPDEHMTLIDFGIARLKSLSGDAILAGSPGYMAPEQPASPTAQSDLYSLALVTCELFTGVLPDLRRPLNKQLPHAAGPRAIAATERALNPDPAKRFATVAEFTAELCAGSAPNNWLRYGAVGAGLLALLITAFFANSRNPQGPFYTKPVPLVTTVGVEYRPSFSPDGQWLFYVAGPLDHLDIFKKATSGGEPIRVVDHPANDDQPEVSPDGRTLAFVRTFPAEHAVVLKALDGAGTETELGRAPEFHHLSWAADGKNLVVAQYRGPGGGTKLRTVDIKSRVWQDILIPNLSTQSDDSPTVSPVGRKLVFVRKWTQGSADLFVLDVDAALRPRSQPRQITHNRERIESVQWTPDGRDLIYLAGPIGNGSLWRIPAQGGARSAVLSDLSRLESLAIPRHAWKLAYSIHLSDSNIWRFNLGRQGGKAFTPVIAGTYNDEEACLSPDGRWIAFSSGRSGEEQIWVAGADGSNPRQITSLPSPDSMSVLWTRDSQALIVSIRSKELGERIYRTPAIGSPALTELMQHAMATDLSRDGRRLYVCKRIGSERQIWRADYPGLKQVERVIATESRVARESPDGQWLHFTKRTEREGVWQQPVAHGPAKRVVDHLYRRNLFVPGRNGLFYIAPTLEGAGIAALFFRDHQSGHTSRLHTFDREVFWGLDLSPDEHSLLFSQFDVNNADIMLVDSFR